MISCKIKVLPVAVDCCLPCLLPAAATVAATAAAPVFVTVIHHLHTTASACNLPLVRLTPAPVAIGMAADCCTAADVYLILYIVGNQVKSNMDCGWHCSWFGVGVIKSKSCKFE